MSTPLNVVRPTYKTYEANYYEAVIESITQQDNKYWNPQKPEESTKFQFVVKFKFTDPDGGEAHINAYMAPVLSKNSKLTRLCKAVLPAFDPAMEINEEDLVGSKLRINITVEERQDGSDRNKVNDFSPTKLSPMSTSK